MQPMSTAARYDIVIVGGGPAGLATALHLAERYPALAERTLLLEAGEYPRPKICGGAVTFHGLAQLAALGLSVDVPAAAVHRLRFRFGARAFASDCRDVMHVIQRDDFDAALAAATRRRGVAIRSGEVLQALVPEPGGVRLSTSRASYHARVVVGADGAKSMVRRALGLRGAHGVARLLRVMTPADPQTADEFLDRSALFDFSCTSAGIQGYMWDFPCYVRGQPYLNRGIFDSRIAPLPRGDLKAAFAAGLGQRGVDWDTVRLESHPVRWFNPHAEFARPHVLLAGDAAGVDPLFAEGISYALEYGAVAADAIGAAFERGDWSFADYRARIMRHSLGRALTRKAQVAYRLYTAHHGLGWRMFWRLACVAPSWMNHAVGSFLGVLPPRAAIDRSNPALPAPHR